MGRSLFRQNIQIKNSATYDDTVAPTLANFESNPTELETDLNNVRSMLSYLKDIQAGNWYDAQTAPSSLEAGTLRGVDDLNDALHLVEKKRVLRDVHDLTDITVGASTNFHVLGTGELPSNTTIAVGAVTTLGTVAAAHAGTFGSAHSLDEVAGPNAISPDNLMIVVDGSTRDEILSSGRIIYALLQSENSSDGHTATDTTPNRLQVSFVRINATGDDLEAVSTADIENKTVNLTFRERVRLEDLNEADFLRGAIIDTAAATTVSRQVSYDNQGTTPVDLTTNATLDLEGAGLVWSIRDDLQADLFRIIEGSAGGSSEIEFSADVDTFDNNAVANDFANGSTFNSGGTRPIDIGNTDGTVETTAGELALVGFTDISFTDDNKSGSTWSTDLVLSDTTAEWDDLETLFGSELSLLGMIAAAAKKESRTSSVAATTGAISANTNVTGAGGTPNLDAQLADYSGVTFVDDCDVYVEGQYQRKEADATGNSDVYPGDTPANGDLKFEYDLPASVNIHLIVHGE